MNLATSLNRHFGILQLVRKVFVDVFAQSSHQLLAMRVVVASRSQDDVWKRGVMRRGRTWKDIMRSYASEHSMSEQGRSGFVTEQWVSLGELVMSASAGEHGVVLVPAQTDDQEHMIALGDSLWKLCMAEHDGCTRTCFEKEAGAEKMSEKIFLRHSLQDREWKSGKNFSEAEQFFCCVFSLLRAKKNMS